MKEHIKNTLENYLKEFKDEIDRQEELKRFLERTTENSLTDWNNFDGHIVASGFLYAKKEKKFLVLYHKDMQNFLYPGGHIDSTDSSPLRAAKREVIEETGIEDISSYSLIEDRNIPIDIDTHTIPHNERLDLPSHIHFDFRYLFVIDQIENVNPDEDEMGEYLWLSLDEMKKRCDFGPVTEKLEKLLN